jgi:hypothetical protein
MINRIKVLLPQIEYSGLLELADEDLRTPNEQLRFLLRQELVRRKRMNLDAEVQGNNSVSSTTCGAMVQGSEG